MAKDGQTDGRTDDPTTPIQYPQDRVLMWLGLYSKNYLRLYSINLCLSMDNEKLTSFKSDGWSEQNYSHVQRLKQ